MRQQRIGFTGISKEELYLVQEGIAAA